MINTGPGTLRRRIPFPLERRGKARGFKSNFYVFLKQFMNCS